MGEKRSLSKLSNDCVESINDEIEESRPYNKRNKGVDNKNNNDLDSSDIANAINKLNYDSIGKTTVQKKRNKFNNKRKRNKGNLRDNELECGNIAVTNVKNKNKKVRKIAEGKNALVNKSPQKRKKKVKHRTKDSEQMIIKKQIRALEYLEKWETDRFKWFFKKIIQKWLLKNMYDEAMVPEEKFACLLKYLAGLKGMARSGTIKSAETFLETNKGLDEEKLERYHRILQVLKED